MLRLIGHKLSASFIVLWTLLPLNVFSLPHGVGWGGQEQSTARSLAQFVIVNVVDQYEMCVCVIPIKIQIQLLIFMKLNR